MRLQTHVGLWVEEMVGVRESEGGKKTPLSPSEGGDAASLLAARSQQCLGTEVIPWFCPRDPDWGQECPDDVT